MALSWLTGTILAGLGTFVSKQIGSWASRKLDERKIKKLYEKAGESHVQGPDMAFGLQQPASTSTMNTTAIAKLRQQVEETLVSDELARAQEALDKLRTALEKTRHELAMERAAHGATTEQLQQAQKDTHTVRALLDASRNETVQARADLAAERARHEQTRKASDALKREYEDSIRKGETNVTGDRYPTLPDRGSPRSDRRQIPPLGAGAWSGRPEGDRNQPLPADRVEPRATRAPGHLQRGGRGPEVHQEPPGRGKDHRDDRSRKNEQ